MEDSSLPAFILKPGREKSLLRKHPWVFSGAISEIRGQPGMGDTVSLQASDGRFLGWAAYSPKSQIRARIWSFKESEKIDESFFHRKLDEAIRVRMSVGRYSLGVDNTMSACRLVYAESDGLPGFIIDRYSDTLVMQVLSAGAERWRDLVARLAIEITGATRVFERSDVDVRQIEGLPLRIATIMGNEPPEQITITENGLLFMVDVRNGQKTGFYLDQRSNRLKIRELASDRDVLDCFCYTGGVTVNAIAGGAKSITALDASSEALGLNRKNIEINNLHLERTNLLEGNVFQLLRQFRDNRQYFDMVILDPPKFAPTASQVERASRGYKDINLLAFKLLRPAGILVTFSCSGGISADLFQSIVAGAALDAGVNTRILEYLHQDIDHPVSLTFPEGAYLKGLVIQVV